jgi:hypothetical protein
MKVIPPHRLPEENHLDAVTQEMERLGAPTLKAVWLDGYQAWMALEGSHRIAAAQALGLTPEIEEVEYDPEATTDEVVPGSYQDCLTLEELADRAWEIGAVEF